MCVRTIVYNDTTQNRSDDYFSILTFRQSSYSYDAVYYRGGKVVALCCSRPMHSACKMFAL